VLYAKWHLAPLALSLGAGALAFAWLRKRSLDERALAALPQP
jgi:hypothetical protein